MKNSNIQKNANEHSQFNTKVYWLKNKKIFLKLHKTNTLDKKSCKQIFMHFEELLSLGSHS